MEHRHSGELANNYQDRILSIQYHELLQQNQPMLNEYIEFCSERHVLPIFKFNIKQLYLYGTMKSATEAEQRFFEIQNELFVQNAKQESASSILWWYEAWDGSWQMYNVKIKNEIEHHYKSNIFNFTLINDIGETISFDINRREEIYGQRKKRIRRSKIDELQPNYWTLTPLPLQRFLLDGISKEYLMVRDNFDKKMEGHYEILKSIERIQNLCLFKQFCALHECFINKYGNNDFAAIHYLFHGCPESASNQIIERGFNRNYCGINGCCYGRGVYFSKHADYSNRFAKTNGNNEKRMFYSRVLIGRSMIGNSTINQPNDGFDTTTDGNHIFVCYHDSQCYPEYLLTYV
ncbi:unnamed protein product [Rotaria socialis]|uniref:Poly [ADP-ribose] polymerase n=1 Tax=Rotaria socialis TaxID=392032 RepID=A0A817U1A8_9BILA|nr:unnamed protein product [Rotaria socialis]CAF3633996.1 unnamed protein product [Rotaria socialis]CAF4415235.1 unnamed protein product [Rotaria socialis]